MIGPKLLLNSSDHLNDPIEMGDRLKAETRKAEVGVTRALNEQPPPR